MMENLLQSNLQYALFCTKFVESSGQVSIFGVLDGADVRGTVRRGQPMPQKVFPLKLVLGINAPAGNHRAMLGITKPSGGVMTTMDLESFDILPGETVHRCIARPGHGSLRGWDLHFHRLPGGLSDRLDRVAHELHRGLWGLTLHTPT